MGGLKWDCKCTQFGQYVGTLWTTTQSLKQGKHAHCLFFTAGSRAEGPCVHAESRARLPVLLLRVRVQYLGSLPGFRGSSREFCMCKLHSCLRVACARQIMEFAGGRQTCDEDIMVVVILCPCNGCSPISPESLYFTRISSAVCHAMRSSTLRSH